MKKQLLGEMNYPSYAFKKNICLALYTEHFYLSILAVKDTKYAKRAVFTNQAKTARFLYTVVLFQGIELRSAEKLSQHYFLSIRCDFSFCAELP